MVDVGAHVEGLAHTKVVCQVSLQGRGMATHTEKGRACTDAELDRGCW